MKILILLFLMISQSLLASDWTSLTFREDGENQYWVGVSNPHDNLKDSINEAYNEALKDSVKFNYGFNQSIVENYYSNKKDTSFQQEAAFNTGLIQFKGVKPGRQTIQENNGKFIVFREIIYPKNEISKEKDRLKKQNKQEDTQVTKLTNQEKKFFGLFTVETNPNNANIVLLNELGEKFISKSGMENVLPIGRYVLDIQKSGFESVHREIIITGEPTISKLILEKKAATLFLDITPVDAMVTIDGRSFNQKTINLDNGLHEIKITHKDYLPQTQQIDLVDTDSIAIRLKPKNKSISIYTEPANADVFINGENIGKSPILGKLTKNENINISAIKEGYKIENKFFKKINEENDIITINMNKLDK